MNPVGSQNCTCNPGWAGLNCDAECSLRGQILKGQCHCDVGWRGPLCDIPGCPGDGLDCTGHGDCNTGTHICTCFNGWTGNHPWHPYFRVEDFKNIVSKLNFQFFQSM